MEIRKLANDFRQHVGCVADEIEWDFEDQAGFQMAKISFVGVGENLLTSTGAGTADPRSRLTRCPRPVASCA